MRLSATAVESAVLDLLDPVPAGNIISIRDRRLVWFAIVLAIGLGCDIRHAHRLSCADVYDLANAPVTPVGPACAICPRRASGWGAVPARKPSRTRATALDCTHE